MRDSASRSASAAYPAVGLHATSVPPVRVASRGRPLSEAATARAVRISVVLPAVPTSHRMLPPAPAPAPAPSPPGSNETSVEPTRTPLVRAPHTDARAEAAATCCALIPGLGRPALILPTLTALPVTHDRVSAVLSICPPPSPAEPSTATASPALGTPHPRPRPL